MPQTKELLFTPEWVEELARNLAIELWLKLGRPSTLPAISNPDTRALNGFWTLWGAFEQGSKSEEEKAIKLLRIAASKGCIQACEYLGWSETNPPKTYEQCYRIDRYAARAARAGRAKPDVVAWVNSGNGAPWKEAKKDPMTIDFIDRLSVLDPDTAWYMSPADATESPKEMIFWCEWAVAKGSVRAYCDLGEALLCLERYDEAYAAWRTGAEKGHAPCAAALLQEIRDEPKAYLEFGMHRDRYVTIAVKGLAPHGLDAYAENLLNRNKPGDAIEACKALLVLQESFDALEDFACDLKDVALRGYPTRKGKVPLKPAWDWLWERVIAAPLRPDLHTYSTLWREYVFNPARDKTWLPLEESPY